MNEELDTAARQKKKAVRTAIILGVVVLGYYAMFVYSHLK
jgi:hypothetical protein